jgi:hypothetical protein
MECDHPGMAQCGASGYLQKPLLFNELREVLEHSAANAAAEPPVLALAV